MNTFTLSLDSVSAKLLITALYSRLRELDRSGRDHHEEYARCLALARELETGLRDEKISLIAGGK